MATRTNIVLDDELVAQAIERAGVKTKKAAVKAALRAYVRKPNYAALLALEGSRPVADDYDPKVATPVRRAAGVSAQEPEPARVAAKPRVRSPAGAARRKA